MNCCCENCGWSEIVGSPIMCNYNGHRTWRDECCEAWKPKEKETNMVEVVRCKDCKHLIDDPLFMDDGYCRKMREDYYIKFKPNADWFCADGKWKEER